MVVEGQCTSSRNGKLLDTIGPGDTLGSHAVAPNKLYNSTVQAACGVVLALVVWIAGDSRRHGRIFYRCI